MLKHICPWCRHTRARFECTHGRNTHIAHQTHTTQHNTTSHGDRETERHGEREKEDRERERREDGRGETRQKNQKEDETRRKRRRRDKTGRQEKLKEERQDKTREDERGETRQERMKERRDKMKEGERENERENGEIEMKEKMNFCQKKVSRPSNPPDELAQNVSKTNPFRTQYSSIFSSKVQNLTVFLIIYMIRIRFFGPGELIQNGFSAARYLSLCPSLSPCLSSLLSFSIRLSQTVGCSLRSLLLYLYFLFHMVAIYSRVDVCRHRCV